MLVSIGIRHQWRRASKKNSKTINLQVEAVDQTAGFLLEFGGLRGLQDEAELLTQLLGQSRGQVLVLVPHGGGCTLLSTDENH